jgi:hypothetical protein
MEVEMKNIAILVVNRWSSNCSTCGGNADPTESQHEMLRMHGGPGCGARFVAITSEYLDMAQTLTEMRPDLPQVDMPGSRSAEPDPPLPPSLFAWGRRKR